ncbi:hypothetical protein [Nitrosococcus watsonii]|nr:hypothetical protein [Nitrosococcus watsonii]
MLEIRKTEAYAKWLDGLRDVQARVRILSTGGALGGQKPGGC